MPPEQIAAIGLLGVLFGGIIGWAAARRVDEQRAKREAYARYLGAADEVVSRLVRRVLGARSGASPLEPMPSHEAADTAFSEVLILAPRAMVDHVNQMVDCMNSMAKVASSRDSVNAYTDEWNEASATYNRLRLAFITRARSEVGADHLPARLFD